MREEKKPRMTKARKQIIDYSRHHPIIISHSDRGGCDIFFSDGREANKNVVEGMIACGLLIGDQSSSLIDGISQVYRPAA